METKKCPSCGKNVTGREDKRFCSDECRIFYNNAKRKDRRNRNLRPIKNIQHNIKVLDEADAKYSLRMLAWTSKVLKILSTFANGRNIKT